MQCVGQFFYKQSIGMIISLQGASINQEPVKGGGGISKKVTYLKLINFLQFNNYLLFGCAVLSTIGLDIVADFISRMS